MPKRLNLEGEKYGRWTVIKYCGDSMWECLCDCGKTGIISRGNLRNGTSSSCGCYKSETVRKRLFKDLTDERFGRLKVVEFLGKNEHEKSMYLCACDCGNDCISLGETLRRGKDSCGCRIVSEGSPNLINLIDIKFGRLLVFEKSKNKTKEGQVKWNCLCDCGNVTEVSGGSLKNNQTKSCGCLKNEKIKENGKKNFVDLSGRVFGMLKVIEFLGKDEFNNYCWLCNCECGTEKIYSSKNLTKGIVSCGCLRESYVASEIKKYFGKNYNGVSEYKIVKNPKTGFYLPYDLYLPDEKIFVEVMGRQHYKYVEFFHREKNSFKELKYRDGVKRRYAKKNGIYIEINLGKIKEPEEAISIIISVIKGENKKWR